MRKPSENNRRFFHNTEKNLVVYLLVYGSFGRIKSRQKWRNGMLNVVIADDEERICQLIEALIEWEKLGMQIAGIAHNGLEALELVEKIRPDILITDIRMPGCNGLELIAGVRKTAECEIIIISGYAHFEYAQSAIKYGVGDYLLKPVNQAELYATLKKLKERIMERRESESDRQQLLQKSENDIYRLQMNLMEQLIGQRAAPLTMQMLQEEYYLKVQPGVFQAFCLKIDGKIEELSESGLAVVMDKASSLLTSSLRAKCYELVLYEKPCTWIGIMNYPKDEGDEIRRKMRECLNQLEAQKNLYGPVTFSGAVGRAVIEPEQLMCSVKEAMTILKERLVKGTGRILDKMPEESSVHERNLLEKYMRLTAHAIEVLSLEEAERAAWHIKEEAEAIPNINGQEIWELAVSCGRLFLSQLEIRQREQENHRFEVQCEHCGTAEELFAQLVKMQNEHLDAVIKRRENDAVRPIRQAKQYIQNHFQEPITMEEVSSAVGLSSAYFSVLFKKEEGEGFAKYLINLRMEEAKRLLRETNCSVAEICHKVGYSDVKHFTHTFEKAAGVKPATYRKLYG